jgi:hypothetical protein
MVSNSNETWTILQGDEIQEAQRAFKSSASTAGTGSGFGRDTDASADSEGRDIDAEEKGKGKGKGKVGNEAMKNDMLEILAGEFSRLHIDCLSSGVAARDGHRSVGTGCERWRRSLS